jgi:hypothetical protein
MYTHKDVGRYILLNNILILFVVFICAILRTYLVSVNGAYWLILGCFLYLLGYWFWFVKRIKCDLDIKILIDGSSCDGDEFESIFDNCDKISLVINGKTFNLKKSFDKN